MGSNYGQVTVHPLIIDTEKLPEEYRRRVETIISLLAEYRKLKKILVDFTNEEAPPGEPPVDLKICPFCGSEKWASI